MRIRLDELLADTIARGYRKMLPELREKIATAKGPEQRQKLEQILAEMLEWLAEYDAREAK